MAFLAVSAALALQMAFTAFGAGNWQQSGDGRWYYYSEEGQMQTGWVQDGGKWYYLEPSGQMVSKTVKVIDGISYEFDDSGVWIEKKTSQSGWSSAPQPGKWTSGTSFSNPWSDFNMEFPAGYTNESYDAAYDGWIQDFSICSPEGDIMFQAVYKDTGATADENKVNQLMEEYKEKLTLGEGYTLASVSQAAFGNHNYHRATFTMGDTLSKDIYMRPVGNHILILEALYFKGREDGLNRILNAK